MPNTRIILAFLLLTFCSFIQAEDLIIPHLPTDSTSWRSVLQADNTGTSGGTLDVTLYDQGELVFTQQFTVDAQNETLIDLSVLAPSATNGTVTTSGSALNVRLSYENLQTGGIAEFSLMEGSAQRLAFYFTDFVSSIAWKGIAIANMSAETSQVTLTAWGGGDVLGQTVIEIQPNSRTRGIYSDWFPQVSFNAIKKIVASTSAGELSGIFISGSSDSSQLLFGTADALPITDDFEIVGPTAIASPIFDGTLIAADYWSDEAKILSAGLGFCDIGGILADEINEETVREAGGAWLSGVDCGTTAANTLTTTQDQLQLVYITRDPYQQLKDGAIGLDGLPIVFSWPVDTSTLAITDVQITLNTGEIVTPDAISTWPNIENNERTCVVVWGEFGNKKPSSDPESRYVVKCEIVADDNPMMLVNPNGELVSAVGLVNETVGSPYDENNGPRLIGAKLNYVDTSTDGEGFSSPASAQLVPPNHESLLYPEYNGGDYRLRVLTTGGFSPDGVSGVHPTDYEKHFRVHVKGPNNTTVLLEKTDVDYEVLGGTLRVLGLADLGRPEGLGVSYDECYQEDRDNYIDIILVGDDAAARNIEFVEIPSLAGGYTPFYNPGGPGTTPFPEETYTSPGPPDLEPVIMALDNPMRVSYP